MKIILLLFIVACSSGPLLKISSSTPARIEMGGKTVCTSTPCEITGYSLDNVMGQCVRGTNSNLEAFPVDKTKGYTQWKKVYGDCNEEAQIYFDMKSRGGVRTIGSED